MKKLTPNKDNCSHYWAQLVKDTPDHTDKKTIKKGRD